MRIEDVPEEYRDSAVTRALFALEPTEEQRLLLAQIDLANRSGECVLAFIDER